MSARRPLPALARRLAVRAAVVCAWLVVHSLAARWLASWDVGLHLLGGGRAVGSAIGALLGFFAMHLTTYFVLPALVAISVVGAVVRYVDEVRAARHG